MGEAEILLFHHAQGLTPGVIEFADKLRKAGNIVHTPDLFEGRTFNSIEDGMDADPYFVGEGDIDAARELVKDAEDAELFLYPGDQHYFADSSLPSYDAVATSLLLERGLEFLNHR
jgi:dienelactone hydrolase